MDIGTGSWRAVEASPDTSRRGFDPATIAFAMQGATPVLWFADERKPSITCAEGTVILVTRDRLRLDTGLELSFLLPDSIDVAKLVGERVKITVGHLPLANGATGQHLKLARADGTLRLVAHLGPAQGNVHKLGALEVRAALSQRPGGSMTFGTKELQCAVREGERVTIGDGANAYVMHFIARSSLGHGAYVVCERDLWRGA